MKKGRFSTTINASREKVWDVLWNNASYREWTAIFNEGSHAVSDWKEGGKVLFMDPKGEGMHSVIARKIPCEFMSFRHVGVLHDGKEAPMDEETKKWSGAMEDYTLRELDGKTELIVEMDITDENFDYFSETFPKALKRVKELAESQTQNS